MSCADAATTGWTKVETRRTCWLLCGVSIRCTQHVRRASTSGAVSLLPSIWLPMAAVTSMIFTWRQVQSSTRGAAGEVAGQRPLSIVSIRPLDRAGSFADRGNLQRELSLLSHAYR